MGTRIVFSQQEKEKIISQYVLNKLSLRVIGNQYNVDKRVIKQVLLENNIHIRNASECQRKYKLNEDFFNQENNLMSYVLGFLASDGCVTDDNQIIINLSQKDRNFLMQLNTLLGNEREIKDYSTNEGYLVSKLQFSSKKIADQLKRYNIVPRKTKIFSFPKNLNSEYSIDFIRGYFDGDGSIYQNGYNSIGLSITSYKEDVLQDIQNIFKDKGIINGHIRKRGGPSILYDLRYYTPEIKQIYLLFYKNNPFCLMRKRQRMEELLNEINLHEPTRPV